MIDGHGDDLYKYGIDVLKANFSSNIYGPTNNQALKEHLIRSISVIDSYPEPEPYSLQERLAEKLH
ncbi:MAG: threonine-phosphate decarboxylase, partial [Porphyromonadaceae bacterium]|nr:threonine-phosphate decarboxylase [Porphyromonadaceae bacterium]